MLWRKVLLLYLFNAFSDLVRPVVFIMRFGSVAIMFSIALYPRKHICFRRLLLIKGVENLSIILLDATRWVMAQEC